MKAGMWLVAAYEFRALVLRRSFIIAVLSMPLLIGFTIGLVTFTSRLDDDWRPVGYVDPAGVLARGSPMESLEARMVEMIPFATEQGARNALEAGEIQSYYLLGEDFSANNRAELVFLEQPGDNARRQFWDWVQVKLMSDQPAEVARRVALLRDDDIVVKSPDGSRAFHGAPTLGQLAPILTGFAFMILVLSGGNQLVRAVAEEKESRTVEVLITSISSDQLMAGKVVGIVLANLVQVAGWLVALALAILVGRNVLGIAYLQDLQPNPQTWQVAVLLLPAYLLVVGLMTAIGATVAEVQEGQQIAGLFGIPMGIPFWLIAVIMENPNGPLAVGLSFFPLTAPLTMGMRIAMTHVPPWQFLASLAILGLCGMGAVWLAGRAFRLGMLRYGKRLRLADLVGRRRLQNTLGGTHG